MAESSTSSQPPRQYDVVVFGATGYTGKFTAERVATELPSNRRWALAGRSADKLSAVRDSLKQGNPNRSAPAIEVVNLDANSLNALAPKTRILLNTVGPFAKYGEVVLAACAKHGTHYLDATGEVHWVKKMMAAYESQAKKSGAIIIPMCALVSAVPDVLVCELVDLFRDKYQLHTRKVDNSLYTFNEAASGGTMQSIITLFEQNTLQEYRAMASPTYLCSEPVPKFPLETSALSSFAGVRYVKDLGWMTSSGLGGPDMDVVYRSAQLLRYSGPSDDFYYFEGGKTSNAIFGLISHLAITYGALALVFAPIRWLLGLVAPKPGSGATRETAQKQELDFRAIAESHPDQTGRSRRAFGRFYFRGGPYDLTGLTLVAGAEAILQDQNAATRAGGGFLTPAMLGHGFAERLRKGGAILEVSAESD